MPRKTREEEKIIRRILFFLWVGLIFAVDQATKFLILRSFASGQSRPVISNVFHLTLVQNTGAAFGILADSPMLLTAISALVLAGLLFILPSRSLGWSLILGGALGNLYDRLRFGYVIDFLDFRIWPVFNIADSCICAGVVLILWRLFRHESRPI